MTGHGSDGITMYSIGMEILHRRGEDPIVMACRRDGMLAKCDRISVETQEAFMETRFGLPVRRRKADIPKDEKAQWTFENIPD